MTSAKPKRTLKIGVIEKPSAQKYLGPGWIQALPE